MVKLVEGALEGTGKRKCIKRLSASNLGAGCSAAVAHDVYVGPRSDMLRRLTLFMPELAGMALQMQDTEGCTNAWRPNQGGHYVRVSMAMGDGMANSS